MKKYLLVQYRKEIEKVDLEIIKKIEKRLLLSRKIAQSKKENVMPLRDLKREKQLKERYKMMAKKRNIDEKFILRVFRQIFAESLRKQKQSSGSVDDKAKNC